MKTINISENEVRRRLHGRAGASADELEDGFFRKLWSDLEHAKTQMLAYDFSTSVRKAAYVVVNFDDNLHEYVDRYRSQIDQFMRTNAVPDLDIVFDIREVFESARGPDAA